MSVPKIQKRPYADVVEQKVEPKVKLETGPGKSIAPPRAFRAREKLWICLPAKHMAGLDFEDFDEDRESDRPFDESDLAKLVGPSPTSKKKRP